MKAERPSLGVALPLLLLAGTTLLAGCGDDDSGSGMTSTSVTISAPVIVSPDGGNVADRPTLVVANVTVSDGSGATYTFQVATDANFNNIVAERSERGEDASGETSWRVTPALEGGNYSWRARASAGGTDGPFSSVANFKVNKNVKEPEGREILFDPLTNGRTEATRRGGGRLTPDGWLVTSRFDFLRYEIRTLEAGSVEWQMTGLEVENNRTNEFMVMGMWDPTDGAYRDNAFRVHVLKIHPPQHNPPFLRMRWISQGDLGEDGTNFLRWDPNQIYTWLLEWGPVSDDSNFAFLYLDGRLMLEIEYDPPYTPTNHTVEMGIAARAESITDAVYLNVRIFEN
jgi:hypothetical protein